MMGRPRRGPVLHPVDPCEWNPSEGRAAYDDETHANADLVVGANGQWRLCRACAALPRFARFRRRVPVKRPLGSSSVMKVRVLPERKVWMAVIDQYTLRACRMAHGRRRHEPIALEDRALCRCVEVEA